MNLTQKVVNFSRIFNKKKLVRESQKLHYYILEYSMQY